MIQNEYDCSKFNKLSEQFGLLENKVNCLENKFLEKERLKNKKSVAIWIDGPNFGRLAGEMNILMPITELVRTTRWRS